MWSRSQTPDGRISVGYRPASTEPNWKKNIYLSDKTLHLLQAFNVGIRGGSHQMHSRALDVIGSYGSLTNASHHLIIVGLEIIKLFEVSWQCQHVISKVSFCKLLLFCTQSFSLKTRPFFCRKMLSVPSILRN